MIEICSSKIPAYIASFPMQLQVPNPSSLQYNQLQQGAISCGVDIAMNPSQLLPQKEGSSSVPMTEVYHDSSSGHVISLTFIARVVCSTRQFEHVCCAYFSEVTSVIKFDKISTTKHALAQ